MTTSPAGQALPMVAPMPLVGRVDAGAQGMPSEVVEQLAMAAIPLSMTERTGLQSALMAPTMVGVAQSVMTPPMQVEVVAAVIDGS